MICQRELRFKKFRPSLVGDLDTLILGAVICDFAFRREVPKCGDRRAGSGD